MDSVQDRVRDSVNSLFLGDVEMGKKDDDHNRGGASSGSGLRTGWAALTSAWASARVHPRKFAKRLVIAITVGFFIYIFIKNIPKNPVRDHRRPVYHNQGELQAGRAAAGQGLQPVRQQPPQPPKKAPPPPDAAPAAPAAAAAAAETYDGPLRFVSLGESLRGISATRGSFLVNKNVLFAAASVKSMTRLLPLACQMGSELRSYVHFAIMSRSTITLAELQQMNGIDASCNIYFHDARPDYAAISTDSRMENSVDVAMTHIQLYMHPQAIIIDGTDTEEDYLQAGMKTYAKSSQTSLIQMPRNGIKRLGWIAKLDSASLSNWNKISIDILIHAYPGASGSLIRLLKSLAKADFGGGSVPHVTIELPQKIDPPTEKYLETFQWPPAAFKDASGTRQLSLRHRIPRHGVSEEESSTRFLESFWPSHPQNSHVLVLSPQTELSREFFHYIKFALLEYRYSNPALLQEWDKRLFGISLDLPSTALDGVTKLTPPLPLKKADAVAAPSSDPSSFLWQSPNSNAILFLGERWAELHRFVAQLLELQHKQTPADTTAAKRVSKKYPSWLEHALELCQARGLWTLYPSSATASALATVHNELYKMPEEYDTEDDEEGDRDDKDEVRLGTKMLMETLTASSGGLPPFADLPLLSWNGQPATLEQMNEQVVAYRTQFRRTKGGCSEGMLDVLLPETLFCTEDE